MSYAYAPEGQILSGALHYFRLLPQQWRHRLTLLRAMGLDTVETYVPWNLHEPRPGRYDFSGIADLEAFLRTAADVGLRAIVRPGPYICAEWENGGLPAWLRANEKIPLRCADPRFLEPVDRWFDELIPRIAAHQTTRGGNVLMVQVENEYGSYGNDADYLRHLADGLVRRGIDVPLFTSDGPSELMLDGGAIPGIWATLNFGSRPDEAFDLVHRLRPKEPEMCMEYWNGWFDHWGEQHHTRDVEDAAGVLAEMVDRGASVNLYMAHGGSNFGPYAGANHDPQEGYLPTTTSYDYDAPITEDGRPGPKFAAYRKILTAGRTGELPPVPAPDTDRLPPASVEMTDRLPLLACVDALTRGTVASAAPLSFEEMGHDYGLALYRTRLTGAPADEVAQLTVDGLRDRAHVFVDGLPAGLLERDGATAVEVCVPAAGAELAVLVEAMGRVNYGPEVGERKGVTGSVRYAYQHLFGWRTDPIALDDISVLPWDRSADANPAQAGPAFYRGTLTVDQPGDAFLELPLDEGEGKGFVWVNGFWLGRYWDRGPQRRLYLPWPLLRTGDNEIVVLELDHAESQQFDLRVCDEPGLGQEH
ncbi:glycoside hydrolase family 35 protein [Streptomyces sp. NBC_00829]|uniref:glycoside hydrolase family 35 protein n=1 Tax=Streptomyces sp. NBC_00829 TaxID=2903679 RepID=UPI0038635835|nr:beta-galactosidase [Streptomyces sp. NBC_00829]